MSAIVTVLQFIGMFSFLLEYSIYTDIMYVETQWKLFILFLKRFSMKYYEIVKWFSPCFVLYFPIKLT